MNYVQLRDALNRTFGKASALRPVFEFAQGVDFGARYFRHHVLPAPRYASTREVFVEWVNYCNLRCNFCALDHALTKQRMALSVWQAVLQELTSDVFAGVHALHLHNGGETLLHPNAPEFLSLLDEHFMQAKLRGKHLPKVDLLTNGTVLNESKRKALLGTQSLSTIRLSMDGGTPEAYEAMRNRAKWPVFFPQVVELLEENRQMEHPKHIGIIALLPNLEAMRKKEFHPEYQYILDLADEVEFRLAHNWAGQLEGEEAPKSKPWKLGCSMMMDQLVVLPDGSVSICCNDLNGKAVVGNLQRGGLEAAYRSELRTFWLQRMARNRTQDIPLCSGCERF